MMNYKIQKYPITFKIPRAWGKKIIMEKYNMSLNEFKNAKYDEKNELYKLACNEKKAKNIQYDLTLIY